MVGFIFWLVSVQCVCVCVCVCVLLGRWKVFNRLG